MSFKHHFVSVIVFVCIAIFTAAKPASTEHTYKIMPGESNFTYYMTHPMHSWEGTSKKASGKIMTDDRYQNTQISVSIPVRSFDSHNQNRDTHMAEVVESYIYKNVTFKSTDVKLDSFQTGNDSTRFVWLVKGDLTFHGVTHSIETPVHVAVAGSHLDARGEFIIKPSEYDITLPSLLMVKIKDYLKMDFDVKAIDKSSTL